MSGFRLQGQARQAFEGDQSEWADEESTAFWEQGGTHLLWVLCSQWGVRPFTVSFCSFQWEESEARLAETQKSHETLAQELENRHAELEAVSRNKNLVRGP